MKKSKLLKVPAAMLAGATLGMMFAPKEGKELRKDAKKKVKEVADKAKNITDVDIKDSIKNALEVVSKKLEDLELEESKEKLTKKAGSIKKEIEKIIKDAKNIKDDVLENTAVKLKEQAEEKIQGIVNKLED